MLKVIPEMSNTMMVVVVLIATMAFQSAIAPAGGVWLMTTPRTLEEPGKL